MNSKLNNPGIGDKKTATGRAARFFKLLFLKLFRINDTPHKIAFGFALGVFLGVIPGTGVIAALVLAVVFKVNRVSALLGSVLTNTWLSIPVFFLSVHIGALVTGVEYNSFREQWTALARDFHWEKLAQASFVQILAPVAVGYLIVSALLAALAYFATLLALRQRQFRGHITRP